MRFSWPYVKKNPTRMRVLGLTRDPDIPTGQGCSRKEYSSVAALARINMPRTAAAETESGAFTGLTSPVPFQSNHYQILALRSAEMYAQPSPVGPGRRDRLDEGEAFGGRLNQRIRNLI